LTWRRNLLTMVLLEKIGTSEAGERRRTMHCGGRVVALLRQLHCLASCPLLRFSSASRRTLFRVRRIRPHRHTLRLVSPRHQIVRTIRPHRTAALASEAEAGGEEEAETEERRHHHRVRSWIREEYCMQLGLICADFLGRQK